MIRDIGCIRVSFSNNRIILTKARDDLQNLQLQEESMKLNSFDLSLSRLC